MRYVKKYLFVKMTYADLLDNGAKATERKCIQVIRAYILDINDPSNPCEADDVEAWKGRIMKNELNDILAIQQHIFGINSTIDDNDTTKLYNEEWMEPERKLFRAIFQAVERAAVDKREQVMRRWNGNMKDRDMYYFEISKEGNSPEHFMRDGNAINKFQWNGKTPERTLTPKKGHSKDQVKSIKNARLSSKKC